MIDDLHQTGKAGKNRLKKQSSDLKRNVNSVWVVGTDRKNINACRGRKEAALQRCAINYWNRWLRRTSWNYFTEMAFWQYAGFVAEQMPLRRSGCFPQKKLFFFPLKTWTPENQTFHICLLTLEILPRKLPTTFHANSRQNFLGYFLFFYYFLWE